MNASEYPQEITNKDRYNAMISYAFLAGLFLLSRDPAFTHPLIRAHAKKAFVIHLLFVSGIFGALYFSEKTGLILLNLTLTNILFILFFSTLLYFLGRGMLVAYRGQIPTHVWGFQTSGFQAPTSILISTTQMPILRWLAASIPWLGMFLKKIHGDTMITITRLGHYWFILSAFLLWWDTSDTLFIILFLSTVSWLIYNIISAISTHTIRDLGAHLPSVASLQAHVLASYMFLRTIWHREDHVFSYTNTYRNLRDTYAPLLPTETHLLFTALPGIHIRHFWKRLRSEPSLEILQYFLLDLVWILGFIWNDTPLLILALYGQVYIALQVKQKSDITLPFIREIATILQHIIHWKQARSAKKTETLTLHTKDSTSQS